jgi:hypothetical protein
MQPSHTSHGVALDAVARACGFANVMVADDAAGLEVLRALVGRTDSGPTFATVTIDAATPPRCLPPRDGTLLKTRFRASFGPRVT